MPDLVVLGATPAGLAAAIAAAEAGCSVLVLERSHHIGGLPANGLGVTDITTRATTGGFFHRFIQAVQHHYLSTYGPGAPQVNDSDSGYRFEPHVAESIFEAMLAAQPRITVLRRRQFDSGPGSVTRGERGIISIHVTDRDTGQLETHDARTFIDATYEGDLAAAAGVPYRVGRESAAETGEPFAGRVYWSWFDRQVIDHPGDGDDAVQAYNYRVCLTTDPSRRVPIEKPLDYRREDYLSIIDDVRAGRLRHAVYRYPRAAVAKPVPIPNGKFDTNDHPKSLISTDLPEENWPYPEAGWAWRDRFAQRLRDYELGMLWFCQHDPELPEAFRADALQWGLPLDEFPDNGHFPRQLYVREARRMVGRHVFSALDCMAADDVPHAAAIVAGRRQPVPDQRPPLYRDSITASHYPIDSHACRKREPGREALDGYFALNEITRPYTVPWGVIVPREISNLLVPVACSATHLGFGTLRMEPCWMALGEAAGVAAAIAAQRDCGAADLPVDVLQRELLLRGAVLVYFDDVPPEHPASSAFQWLALRGLFAGYSARPDEALDEAEWRRWCDATAAGRPTFPQGSRSDAACHLVRHLFGEG